MITADYKIKLITKSCVWNGLFSVKKVCMWAISAWKNICNFIQQNMNIVSSSLFSNSLFIHPTNIYSVPTITGKHLSMDHLKKKISKSSLKQAKGALHSYMSLNSQINPVRKKKNVFVCVCVRAQKTSLEREYLAWAHTLRGEQGPLNRVLAVLEPRGFPLFQSTPRSTKWGDGQPWAALSRTLRPSGPAWHCLPLSSSASPYGPNS